MPPTTQADGAAMADCCRTATEQGGTCVFGCGSIVDSDTGMCPSCREHSADRVECDCGRSWERWDGQWTEVR